MNYNIFPNEIINFNLIFIFNEILNYILMLYVTCKYVIILTILHNKYL